MVRDGRSFDAGSSPLTRGALSQEVEVIQQAGLIPAHAGSTFSASLLPAIISAHPRSRGEHVSLTVVVGVVSGSSPLTRGAQQPQRD